MSFGLNIHHIFARDVLKDYKKTLDEIFGGAEKNPFNLDADFNRIAHPTPAEVMTPGITNWSLDVTLFKLAGSVRSAW